MIGLLVPILLTGIGAAPAPLAFTQVNQATGPVATSDRSSSWRNLRPGRVPMTGSEIPNSGRGMYEWVGVPAPGEWPIRDVYYRDQTNWVKLEPTAGSYNFSAIEQGLSRADALGGRFSFRVMTFSPGFGNDVSPAYLPRQANGTPDWNNDAWLSAWERLWARLGAAYGNDPRMGTVDIGGYGSWGEWHLYGMPPGTAPITSPNALRVIAAVVNAFPNGSVLMNASDSELATMALEFSPRVGLRVDCLGEPQGIWSVLQESPLLSSRWRTQPLVGEWCNSPHTSTLVGAAQVRQFHFSTVGTRNSPQSTNGSTALTGSQLSGLYDAARASGYRLWVGQVRVRSVLKAGESTRMRFTWRNSGVAPTYDDWQVDLAWKARGVVQATTPLGVQLRGLLPGTHRVTETLQVPDLPPGEYRLLVSVRDPEGYLAPMGLANSRRTRSGYALGHVHIG